MEYIFYLFLLVICLIFLLHLSLLNYYLQLNLLNLVGIRTTNKQLVDQFNYTKGLINFFIFLWIFMPNEYYNF
jgi:hypothetical protein